eukprot:TRINITY_DN1843_c1_g1_i2.p1 TRINITY_DN1843_c1_g1~~TRINITY_DN1843_c1_g1_i2.p1  ORF type:complete len:1500 (-),score=588.09 TRINITY_DN1843_c1_g1_i2:141-4463(-)
MSAQKADDKLKKKLKNFFDKNASLKKRWTSLISYVERATADELNKFFNENFYMIYGVFLDTFSAYEANCKKSKHSTREIEDILMILKNVLIHLAELIRRKWQTRSIATILLKVLCKENKMSVRVLGFELLLMFLEAVGVPEPSQVELFASAIDLSPFQTAYSQITLRNQPVSAPDKQSVLLPSSGSQNGEQQAVQLFDILLEYVSQKPSNFEFWFDLIKEQYFTAFYPEVCKSIGLLKDDNTGFKPYCPHQLQAVLISKLKVWMKNDQIVSVLWSKEDNVQIMLEIYRQSCRLSIQCDETIKEGIDVFKSLFWSSSVHADIKERIIEYRKFFMQQLKTVFTSSTPQGLEDTHIAVCKGVLELIKQLFLDLYENLADETRDNIMYTVLSTTTSLLDGTGNKVLADNLASLVLDAVLFMWIRTKTRKEELWDALQEGIFGLFHFMEPITQCKLKIIQLTWIIRQMMYPVKQKKKKPVKREGQAGKGDPSKTAISLSPDSVSQLQPCPADPKISGLNWTVDDLVFVWTKVLHIFGKVNTIKDPKIHAKGIGVLTDVIAILLQAENAIPYEMTQDTSLPEQLPLIDIFGTWLFEACGISGSYIQGKAAALGALCSLVVRHSPNRIPLHLLTRFYEVIHKSFKEHSNSIVSYSILTKSNNIFSLALPGASVLAPHYLAEIKIVLDNAAKPAPPKDVRTKSILIAASLLCYPQHFSSLPVPGEPGSSSNMRFSGLKAELKNLFIDTANNDPLPEHKIMCIWALCNMVFEDLLHDPSKSLVTDIIKVIMSFCTSSAAGVARAALDSLSTITLRFEDLRLLDASLIVHIIDSMCGNIKNSIETIKVNPSKDLEEQIAAHFYCLLDFLMASTVYPFDDTKMASTVFGAIELGLLGQKLKLEPVSLAKIKEEKKMKRMSVRDPPTASNDRPTNLNELLDNLRVRPLHNSDVVKEAANILLVQLCNFLQNFPCKSGIEILSSLVQENDDVEEDESVPLYYIYNDFALFSLVEIPLEDGDSMARVIMRDATGKYAWDARINYDHLNNGIEPPCSLLKPALPPPPFPELDEAVAIERDEGAPPQFLEGKGDENQDQLEALMMYLSEFDDCLPESKRMLNSPATPRRSFASDLEQAHLGIQQQYEDEVRMVEAMQEERPSSTRWTVTPPDPPEPNGAHHYSRLFLNHFGYLTFDNKSSFHMVENTQRFQRSVVQLDKTSGREMLKIGVIFVTQGQDDQKVILRNDQKSPLYAEFVRGIGWPIDIASHRGYLGGLDPHLTTGTTAPYYANAIMEVVFHEITSMPTNPSDPQQIHKKRHVGNDIVHIIYSEHSSDYDPTTITSQFNDAHIIVYPLPNGLYRIQIYRKENVPLFGPLLHGMCVNKKLLPILVRQTAINANRYVRYNTGGYSRPFPTRRRALDEIVERFKEVRPYEDLIGQLIAVGRSEGGEEDGGGH